MSIQEFQNLNTSKVVQEFQNLRTGSLKLIQMSYRVLTVADQLQITFLLELIGTCNVMRKEQINV